MTDDDVVYKEMETTIAKDALEVETMEGFDLVGMCKMVASVEHGLVMRHDEHLKDD